MATLFGALVFTGLAALLVLRGDGRSVLPWVVAALVLYALVVVLTLAVNVPLNDQLKAAGDPDRIADLAAVRERFNEARWVGWNLVRRNCVHRRVRLPVLGPCSVRAHRDTGRAVT